MRRTAQLLAVVSAATFVIGCLGLGVRTPLTSAGPRRVGHSARAAPQSPDLAIEPRQVPPFAPMAECDPALRWTPLHHAAFRGWSETVTDLLEGGQDPNARTATGVTPLHCGAHTGDPAIAIALIEHGADVNARTGGGSTPLHSAVTYDRAEYMRPLLGAGARSDTVDLEGLNPLDRALQGNRTRAVTLLRAWGTEPSGDPGRRPTGVDTAREAEEDAR